MVDVRLQMTVEILKCPFYYGKSGKCFNENKNLLRNYLECSVFLSFLSPQEVDMNSN